MRKAIGVGLPLLILALALAGAVYLFSNPPRSERVEPPPGKRLSVATVVLERAPYTVTVESFGFVRPHTQSVLVAQVGGQIMEVNRDFRDGGFFAAGERLLLIDPRDYEIEVRIREAQLVTAREALVEEQARVTQAKRDWQRIGGGASPPPALVSREPQLRAAEAAVASAQAALDRAELDLQRTAILAPYAGRIRTRNVDLGQVVAAGSELAEIYATDAVEVSLPIKNGDLPFLELPEDRAEGAAPTGGVTFTSELAPDTVWQAALARTEGAIDSASRQLRVVARIDDPYAGAGSSTTTIKIGQYLVARITGRTLERALVIPDDALYQGSYVYVVEDGVVNRRAVSLAWRNDDEALVADGLESGDRLVVTPLGAVSSGTRVAVGKDLPPRERETEEHRR